MLTDLIIFAMALAILIKGSDYFVDASAKIAKFFGLSELVIGLTLVAVGTSLPELATSMMASYKGVSDIATGNVIGSNLANICLVLGIALLFGAFTSRKKMFKEAMVCLLITLLTFGAMFGDISAGEGIILLLMFCIYNIYLFELEPHRFFKEGIKFFLANPKEFMKLLSIKKHYARIRRRMSAAKKKYAETEMNIAMQFFVVLFAIALIYFGAEFLIPSAISIAQYIGVPEKIIALTMIAFGTSVPELAVSMSAIRKKMGEMIVGNIIGSNIANLLLVLGGASLVGTLTVGASSLYILMPIVIGATLLLAILIRLKKQIDWKVGISFLVIYALFLIYLLKIM